MVLFVWFFALVSGWANACLLQGRAAGQAVHAAHTGSVALVESGAAAHSGHGGVDDGTGAARAACQDLCDDEQSTIPSQKLPTAAELGPALLLPVAPWNAVVAPATGPRLRLPGAAPPREPPVAIRFLRLTI
ncbi:MAG: hypothetical protein J0M00_11985 [Burkholderiales bacterium]|nr:hypothetical protein [Burkholderiales bacterium]